MSADHIQQQAIGGIEEFTSVANNRYCKIQLISIPTSTQLLSNWNCVFHLKGLWIMGRTENASFAKDDVGAARDESPRLSLTCKNYCKTFNNALKLK